ncbi:universal stress protein [Serinicoccus kebangsaanensis]|uniref:universal stress protein n=1 Tax=Serinicoccus kebangsaanensis TaxID=2602069 RepID=UPI00124C512F|nr:universal stress protein [Serinicoccus kebangsaanensis]
MQNLILVGYVPTPQGEAALRRAIRLAQEQDGELVVLNFSSGDAVVEDRRLYDDQLAVLTDVLDSSGATYSIRRESHPGNPADELLATARQLEVDVIVIGLRRRSATGKFLFGSTAQRVLLEADCDVLAVKPPRGRA